MVLSKLGNNTVDNDPYHSGVATNHGVEKMLILFQMLKILMLAFVQNISFSIVSRSRNRNNIRYHLIAATFSNAIWFLTFRELVKADMNFVLFLPYVLGTICGSCCGVKISMFIERLLGASADRHLKAEKK